MKIAKYLRVSTKDKNQDPETQNLAIDRYLKQFESYEIVETYVDSGVSGAKEKRPALERLKNDMRDGKFDTIVIYKLDRIMRNVRAFLSLHDELKSKKIKLISVTENIRGGDSPMDKLFITILATIAEVERETTVERVKAGLARARASGKKLGRPKGSRDKKVRRKSGYYLRYKSGAFSK